MDGLLLDSEVYWERARRDFCRSIGCDWTPELELGVKGMNSREWATEIARACGTDGDHAAIIKRVTERMIALYEEHLPLLPGAERAVRELAQDYPLGLASSSPPELIRHALGEAGLLDAFQALVSSDDVGKGKPSPDVFLVTAQRLGISPEEVIVFEDSSSGIGAACAAGMRVIVVPNVHYPPNDDALRRATLVLPNLDALNSDTLSSLDALAP